MKSRKVCKAPIFILIILFVMASFLPCIDFGYAQHAPTDISHLPEAVRAGIDHCVQNGYMSCTQDGRFRPDDTATRIELAEALVKSEYPENELDGSVKPADMNESDRGFIYASTAVAKGIMDLDGEGNFKPDMPVLLSEAAMSFVRQAGLKRSVADISKSDPSETWYASYITIFQSLRLKYRHSKVWPNQGYNRGELAFSVKAFSEIAQWREDFIKYRFRGYNVPEIPNNRARRDLLKDAYSLMGSPYLYAGDTIQEGGFDCSGFVYYLYHHLRGYRMNRVAADQAADPRYRTLTKGELQPGDPIFFYENEGGGYINHAAVFVGNGLFIHATGSNAAVGLDYLYGYWGTHFACGKRILNEPYDDNFDEYISIFNPGGIESNSLLKIFTPDGQTVTEEVGIAPESMKSIWIDGLLDGTDVSAEVRTKDGSRVVCERTMFFRYAGKIGGGHSNSPVRGASRSWHFAEGYCGPGFETWILLENNETAVSDIELKFMFEDSTTYTLELKLDPLSRTTVFANHLEPVSGRAFSLQAHSVNSTAFVAERSVYFSRHLGEGGHVASGINELTRSRIFAEAHTGEGFETWLLVANPHEESIDINISYFPQEGHLKTETHTLKGNTRLTIRCNDVVENSSFSIQIDSENGFVAERASYFHYKNSISGGHVSVGHCAPSQESHLVNLFSAHGFETYILIANPSDETAAVELEFFGPNVRHAFSISVGARSRSTALCNNHAALMGEVFSVRIKSSVPVMVEGATYFDMFTREGGYSIMGTDEPGELWLFAEGYTG